MKYEGPNSHQSKDMANVKVFADKETDKQPGQTLYAPIKKVKCWSPACPPLPQFFYHRDKFNQ